jgi:hypothetical protein
VKVLLAQLATKIDLELLLGLSCWTACMTMSDDFSKESRERLRDPGMGVWILTGHDM